MLNLEFVYADAIRAMSDYADRLAIAPLPATVYLMQLDVINHYRYALDHYLTMPLDAAFLQNSSLGTPYEKWAYFTNQDFGLLSDMVHNLLRYTSRLMCESERIGLKAAARYSEMKNVCNTYTDALCEIRNDAKRIGVMAHPDNRLSVTYLRDEPCQDRLVARNIAGSPTNYFRVTQDVAGNDCEHPITLDDFKQAAEIIKVKWHDIVDRSQLLAIKERGDVELAKLRERNATFKRLCDDFYRSRAVTAPFNQLNESYWT